MFSVLALIAVGILLSLVLPRVKTAREFRPWTEADSDAAKQRLLKK